MVTNYVKSPSTNLMMRIQRTANKDKKTQNKKPEKRAKRTTGNILQLYQHHISGKCTSPISLYSIGKVFNEESMYHLIKKIDKTGGRYDRDPWFYMTNNSNIHHSPQWKNLIKSSSNRKLKHRSIYSLFLNPL
jgi:hypothetical protein